MLRSIPELAEDPARESAEVARDSAFGAEDPPTALVRGLADAERGVGAFGAGGLHWAAALARAAALLGSGCGTAGGPAEAPERGDGGTTPARFPASRGVRGDGGSCTPPPTVGPGRSTRRPGGLAAKPAGPPAGQLRPMWQRSVDSISSMYRKRFSVHGG